jgi:gluconate 2-dehydrogenase gamma chain
MAGQGPSRRELLQALSLASAASAFPGFSRWCFAFGEANAQPPVYRPQFFSAGQYQTVEVLSDLILPTMPDASGKLQPGAGEAGVAEFIDFMVFNDKTLQQPFRDGLQWLDHAGTADFVHLSGGEQHEVLERLAFKVKHRADEKSAQQFFQLFRKYTVMGFYTTRIGLESLEYPGLTFYATSPGCTHHGNPEHVGKL